MSLNKRQKLIEEQLTIDAESVKRQIVQFIREYFIANNQEKAIIGFSGGLDSTLIAHLTAEAIGSKNITGLHLPSGDVDIGSNTADVTAVYDILRIPFANRKLISLADKVKIYLKEDPEMSPLTLGNLKARLRMIELYIEAGRPEYNGKAIVIGTSNKSEIFIGYFTKYGDGGVDLEPIGDLFKTQVFQLSRYMGVLENIVEKTPSANLWPGQTDENEIGLSYEKLDVLLTLMLEKKVSKKQLMEYYGYSQEEIEAIERRIMTTEHKRNMPPVCELMF